MKVRDLGSFVVEPFCIYRMISMLDGFVFEKSYFGLFRECPINLLEKEILCLSVDRWDNLFVLHIRVE